MHSCLWRRSRGVVWSTAGSVLVVAACGSPPDHGFFDKAPLAGAGGTTGAGAAAGSAGAAVSGGGGSVGGVSGSAGTVGAGTAGSSGGVAGAGGTAGTGGSSDGGVGATGGAAHGGTGGATVGEAGEAGVGSGGAPQVDCSEHGGNAVDFDGHCYLLRDGKRSWNDARSDCEDRGGHLVTISSEGRSRAEFEAENQFVWQLAGMAAVWLGATDGKGVTQPGDGTYYTWITGEPMTFDAWSDQQPSNSGSSCQANLTCSCDDGPCYEHCGYQWSTEGADPTTMPGWNDRLCEHQIQSVCEWEE